MIDKEPDWRPILPDVSHCGCVLPDGMWGSNGWHHARYHRGLLVNKAKRDWLGEHKDPKDFEYAAAFYDRYLGAAFAVELCPAYRAAIMKDIDSSRARRAPEGGGYGG